MKGYFRKRGSKWSFTIDIGKDAEGKRRQKTASGFRTKKEAQAACAELITKLENNEYVEPSKKTMGEYIAEFMELRVKHNVRESTFNNQKSIVNKHIIPYFAELKLCDLVPEHLERFYNIKLVEGLSPNYVRCMHAILSKALRTAAERGLIIKNIGALVTPPRAHDTEIKTWTFDQVNHFLHTAKDRRLFIAYVLALYTGMRRGEILGLRWNDCDLENGKISVRQALYSVSGKLVFQEPKTKGSRRVITLPDFAVASLRKHRAKQNELKLQLGEGYDDHGLVVANNSGKPVNPSDLNVDFEYATKKAGLPRMRFHDLRHTHATLLLQLGENPKVVSERLGHSKIGITLDTYSHVLPDMQESLANNFDIALKRIKEGS